ncbi:MAG: cytochrome c biogenesis protein CcsA [Candidatus Kapabacteria bacterium]|nr:cytochrome c biogenesis protein CcsA [Candidatus Kapabacteria bacterium]
MVKFLLYAIGLGAAFGIGFIPRFGLPRPLFSRILIVITLAAVTCLAILPPTIGTFNDAIRLHMAASLQQNVNVLIPQGWRASPDGASIQAKHPRNSETLTIRFASPELRQRLEEFQNSTALVTLANTGSHTEFTISEVHGGEPLFALPLIPQLEERARIMYFHVPMSWVAVVAYIVTLVCSILYVRTDTMKWDMIAVSSASVGTLFCALAYITGAIWAKFDWGSFFNWDKKELSVLLLLLIYGAYFALRGSIDSPERRARQSSVYAIVACVAAVFLVFILPRITDSLHPGSANSDSAGPLLSAQSDSIAFTKALVFSLSLSGFTMLYFWMLNLNIRVAAIRGRLAHRQADDV